MGRQAAEDRQDISQDYNKHNPVDYKMEVSAKVPLHFSVRDEIIACHTNYRFYAVVP